MKYYRLPFHGVVVFKDEVLPEEITLRDVVDMLSDYKTAIGVWSGGEAVQEISKEKFLEEVKGMFGEPADYFEEDE